MRILYIILPLLIISCAPTSVQRQALFDSSSKIDGEPSVLLNNFRTDKFEYYIRSVDGKNIGTAMYGSLGIHEILLIPGTHKLNLLSAIINNPNNASANPNWQGELTCHMSAGHYYTVNISEAGEVQNGFSNVIGTSVGTVTLAPNGTIKLACIEHQAKPTNINLQGKTINNDILYSK